jgi:CRP-like cAMP-binding protein
MIDKNEVINQHLTAFAGLSEKDISEGSALWKLKKIKKGDYFNMQSMVCNDLGLVVKGIFRIYHHNPTTDEDKNVYFFSENQFVVSFRSFVSQSVCAYYIEAMEDSEIVFISYKDLNVLYETNINWTRFGKLLAEHFFRIAQSRTEEFIFFSHEVRYNRLIAQHPNIVERIPSYHISSYLGITNPSLSRIRARMKKQEKIQ